MSSLFYKPVSQKLPANEKVPTSSSVDVQYVDTRCGFGMWKPACVQPLATIGVFTACYSFSSLMTQTLMSYVNSQVTTLERQFGFSSRQTGLILAANDIGYLVCVLFAAYMANRIHIPRSLGVAVILYGLSGIACSLPHFLFGASTVDPTRESINSTGSTFSQRSAVSGSLCDLFNSTGDPCGIVAGSIVSPVITASMCRVDTWQSIRSLDNVSVYSCPIIRPGQGIELFTASKNSHVTVKDRLDAWARRLRK